MDAQKDSLLIIQREETFYDAINWPFLSPAPFGTSFNFLLGRTNFTYVTYSYVTVI